MTAPRAMVVEDDRALQLLYTSLFEQQGWDFDLTVNAQQAIDLLGQHTYKIVFLDILLPMVSGLVVLQHIAEMPNAVDVHVVIASASPEYERYIDRVPSAEFLLKPILPGQIRRILGNHSP